MNSQFFQQGITTIPPDLGDEVAVFLYSKLRAIISPTPSVLLTPAFQAGLQVALNSVGPRHHIGLQKDLKDVLDVFIIININSINSINSAAIDTTP